LDLTASPATIRIWMICAHGHGYLGLVINNQRASDPPLPPVRPIPPGSSALRELLAAIVQALTLPTSDTTKGGLTYLRISRDRTRLVMLTCRRLLADREADDTDVMTAVTSLRDQAGPKGM
jgi:hypothetical protein